jgi:hypothetical protein
MRKKKPVGRHKNLAEYRKRFSPDNMETKNLQQKRIVDALLRQIELRRRSPKRLFAAAVDAPVNYIWNNIKIYWRDLAERWEALDVDDGLDLSGY